MKGVMINIINFAEPKIPEDRPPHMNGRDFLLVEVTKPTLNVCVVPFRGLRGPWNGQPRTLSNVNMNIRLSLPPDWMRRAHTPATMPSPND